MLARSHCLLLSLLIGARLIAWQDTAESHLGKAYDALKLDRYQEAADEFRGALRIDPKLTMRARFPLAVALFQVRETAEARREFETVRREAGDHPNILYYLGRLDLLDQNYEAAIRNLTGAMSSPPFPDTAYHLGFAYLKHGDPSAAEKWLKVAAQANPTDSAAPYQLGLVYRKLGREAEASEALARSAGIRQRDTELAQLRRECSAKLAKGPRDEALATCSGLYDENDVLKLTALGTIYGQHGEYEAALAPLRRAAELAPQSPQVQYNLAFTYYQLKRFEEARVPVARAVERWPDIFQLSSLYGAILFELGRPREALPVLRHACQLKPGDAKTSEMLYRTVLGQARASFAARQYSESTALFEEAAKLRPDDPAPRQGLAEVAAATGHAK